VGLWARRPSPVAMRNQNDNALSTSPQAGRKLRAFGWPVICRNRWPEYIGIRTVGSKERDSWLEGWGLIDQPNDDSSPKGEVGEE
jgi:hypothetical protein